MQTRIHVLLRAVKVQDLDSVAEYHADLRDMIAQAWQEGDRAPAAQLMRQRGQSLSALKDDVTMSVEQRASDDELIEAITKGNPEVAAALRERLGAKDTFDA